MEYSIRIMLGVRNMCNGRHGIACLLLAHSFSPVVHKKIDQEENKRNKQLNKIKQQCNTVEVSKIKI